MKSRLELVRNHLNAIAAFFGGWANEDMNNTYIINRYQLLLLYEIKLHTAAEVACDGDGRGLSCYTVDKNKNVEKANAFIKQWSDYIIGHLATWCKNSDKVKERCFVNTDPRGYALKIRITHEEIKEFNLYTDWGGYGIIVPCVKSRFVTNEDGTKEEIWYFE